MMYCFTCFMPCGSMPIWLTATDMRSVPSAPNTGYFQLAGRRPRAGKAALPERRHRHNHRQQTDQEEGAEDGQHLPVGQQPYDGVPDHRQSQPRKAIRAPAGDGAIIFLDQRVSVCRQAF